MGNNNILISLKKIIPELTNTQRQVADYIIKNATESAFLTIEQLARVVGTSTSTIVRLATNLGYAGYSDFQRDLQELLRHRVSPHDRLSSNLKVISDNNLLHRNVETQITNITTTAEHLDEEIIKIAMDEIMKANRVYCLGLRTGYSVAHYLYHGLNRMLGKCEMLDTRTGDLAEKISMITSSDLVIAVTLPRYKGQISDIAKVLKERNTKIIGITDGYSSPLAQYSDIILPCSYTSNAFHNSALGGMFIADHLITSIAVTYADNIKEHLRDVESIIDSLNLHKLSEKEK